MRSRARQNGQKRSAELIPSSNAATLVNTSCPFTRPSPNSGRPANLNSGCAINDGAEGVEVGVHRRLLVDGVLVTADFGLCAPNPFCSDMFVASII